MLFVLLIMFAILLSSAKHTFRTIIVLGIISILCPWCVFSGLPLVAFIVAFEWSFCLHYIHYMYVYISDTENDLITQYIVTLLQ